MPNSPVVVEDVFFELMPTAGADWLTFGEGCPVAVDCLFPKLDMNPELGLVPRARSLISHKFLSTGIRVLP